MPQGKYLPIWTKIKTEGTCKVAASPQLHARIYKAVKKERTMDLEYKFYLAQAGTYVELRMKAEGNMMVFSLYKRPGIGDL